MRVSVNYRAEPLGPTRLEGSLVRNQTKTSPRKRAAAFSVLRVAETLEVGMALWDTLLRCGRQRETTAL